jgi:hypothetical protein
LKNIEDMKKYRFFHSGKGFEHPRVHFWVEFFHFVVEDLKNSIAGTAKIAISILSSISPGAG